MKKFTFKELVFARIVVRKLRKNPHFLPDIRMQETLLLVDFQTSIIDVSKTKLPNMVFIDPVKYRRSMKTKHITVHNHPSGTMLPSDGDHEVAAFFLDISKGKSVWHIIVSPDLRLYTLFGVGRVTKIVVYEKHSR